MPLCLKSALADYREASRLASKPGKYQHIYKRAADCLAVTINHMFQEQLI